MSEQTIENLRPAEESEVAGASGETSVASKKKYTLAPGLKRNLIIIGGVFAVAVILVVVIVIVARGKMQSAGVVPSSVVIPVSNGAAGASATTLTQSEEARLGRVQRGESDAAKENKNTYIPRDLAGKTDDIQAPATNPNGPGKGYSYSTGAGSSETDAARDSQIRAGLEKQLAGLLSRLEAPAASSAPPYQYPGGAGPAQASTAVAGSPTSSVPAGAALASQETIVKGLSIAGARLVSPLDTEKSDFISAEIDSGPLAGAYLIGKGRLVTESGVLLTFTRMRFGDDFYAINANGLDSATSSDAIAADVDRKLMSRYVIPVVFSTLQAYLGAVARPAVSVVTTGIATAQVVTPGATAREAIASGVGAGIGKAGEGLTSAKPSAYIPINTPIALLFNDPVKRATK